MPGLDKIMGMMGGGDPMGMVSKLMQMVKPQEGGESGECSQGGGQKQADIFQQILQQLKPGG